MGAGAGCNSSSQCANFHKRRVLEGAPLHVRPDSVQQSSPCRQHVFVHGPVLVVGPTGVEPTYVRSESELAQKAYINEVVLRSGSSGGELQGTRCARAQPCTYTPPFVWQAYSQRASTQQVKHAPVQRNSSPCQYQGVLVVLLFALSLERKSTTSTS